MAQDPGYTPDADDWARHEFAHLRLGDRRLQSRVIARSRAFAAQPAAAVSQACGSRAATQAAYRLLAHSRLTMDGV